MASLKALATILAGTKLDISGVRFETTQAGEQLAILKLVNPIEEVVGTQSLVDTNAGTSEKLRAFDVDEVKVGPEDIDDAGFDLDDKGVGTYKGDMMLDVSKGNQEVWLKSTSFAAFAREKRNEIQETKKSGILKKIEDARLRRKNSTVVVGAPAGATGGTENVLGKKEGVTA